jgi:glycosyltransferase involved in cell wall biosynthesis
MVSIIITAYNVENFLQQTIESCINQTFKDIEIIIVEDCSTDSTLSIINDFMEKDERIRLIQNKINCGAGQSRRNGLDNAKGDYFLLLDGDDYIENNFIEELHNTAINTDADIVSGGIKIWKQNGEMTITSYGNITTEGYDKVIKFWKEKVVFMNNKLIRTSLHQKVPYCTRRFVEDTPVIIPMLWYANKVVYIDNPGYVYRMQDLSLTHQASQLKWTIFRSLCIMDLIDFFKEHDKEMIKMLNLNYNLMQQVHIIKSLNPTIDEIKKYEDGWIELSLKLIMTSKN